VTGFMRALILAALVGASWPAMAGTLTLEPTAITEWKAVYGRVAAHDLVPARARIGGTLVELKVAAGDLVTAGEKIGLVRDDKLVFQIAALNAQLRSLQAQLDRAEIELKRGQTLVDKGVVTSQRLDQLQTDVEVARNQIGAVEAEREVVIQQQSEGEVLAPADGRVLTVPLTRDAVIMPGEPVANIGSGGFFLRLSIPERHGQMLKEGASIRITSGGSESTGKLVKIYPQIENGRVIADVEVVELDSDFVDARILVEVPVGEREALIVPEGAVSIRSGIDFVTVSEAGAEVQRAVVLGEAVERDGATFVEVLTGLSAGDVVVTP
jgi:RND family efflux transporter MFP subunit